MGRWWVMTVISPVPLGKWEMLFFFCKNVHNGKLLVSHQESRGAIVLGA